MHRALAVALGLMLAAGGCAASPPATAGSATAAPATTTPRGVITLPPRPRDVPIDGVEPCSLFTEQQRAELQMEGRPQSSTGFTQLLGSARSCDIRVNDPRALNVGVTLVTTTGIERFTDGGLATDLTPITVEGFPAVVARPTRFAGFCDLAIDVAPGQLVNIHIGDGGRKPPIPQERLCRDAEVVAAAVMATLLAR